MPSSYYQKCHKIHKGSQLYSPRGDVGDGFVHGSGHKMVQKSLGLLCSSQSGNVMPDQPTDNVSSRAAWDSTDPVSLKCTFLRRHQVELFFIFPLLLSSLPITSRHNNCSFPSLSLPQRLTCTPIHFKIP